MTTAESALPTEERYPPPPAARDGALITSAERYAAMYARSVQERDAFWREQAESLLDWMAPFETVVDENLASGRIGWFLGGRLNVSANCLDRHLARRADKTALLWEGDEPGDNRRVTYAELHEQVCRLANALRSRGIGKGDRVAIYMGMVPELAVAMLACARIGAVHSVIFGGFSAQSIADRIADSACAAVITQDEGRRGGRVVPLKANVDAALEQTDSVRFVIVYQRADGSAPMQAGRDVWWDEAVGAESSACEPVSMDAEDPLFILYTSGSTGKPKGVLHTQAGYLLYATMTHKYVFDLREDDIYCCAADIGWVTGHSYIVYGPLANGATSVMFESIPTYPDAGRYWDMVDRLGITSFYTAPTAIRAIAREGDAHVTRYRRTSLRVLGSVGEPINPEAWRWYFQVVGEGRAAVVDTYWQTETGGHMITGLPGAITMKPGSASVPFFGVQPVIVDPEGREIEGNNVSGLLCMAASWPGMMRTIYGDHDRFIQTYLSQYPGKYFTGDGAYRDHDGYYWLTGRVDDVLNVSGHRIGTAEVEGALVQHEACAEAAVVGYPHDVKGVGIYAYVHLTEGAEPSPELARAMRQSVRTVIGPIATPDKLQFVRLGLPKTRSGKIMRRILRKVAEGEPENVGDVTTLADPSVVEDIVAGAEEAY
ncbi:MAG: acetate--CoA ligase [Chloroflexi bacterium]|nr:acetate--CoA ligase [Chloroflexota bacterium]